MSDLAENGDPVGDDPVEDEFEDRNEEPEPEVKFDLDQALAALANDSRQLVEQLEKDEAKLHKIRQNITRDSRKNFILERELDEIDQKIKLLVKNRIAVDEIMSSTSSLRHKEEKDESVSPLQGRRPAYEQLFYLLQSKPVYLAKLARLVQTKEQGSFVQTVVFDMYGDQYDTREERLLLDLFRRVLRDEIAETPDIGSLLRANTAITQMLSAYARRGQGLTILKDILEQPLRELTNDKELNLEIEPRKVYKQMIQDYETQTGNKSELDPEAEDGAIAQNKEVQDIIRKRTDELTRWCDVLLRRIIDGVDKVPYGMRWICKTLGVLARERWPSASRSRIASIKGGYIYLRFFNPVIVTPDATGFVSKKPSRITRRNLIIIAQVLQKMSNGNKFGEREKHMMHLNPWMDTKEPVLQQYFDQLTDVEDIEDTLQVDKYLEHTLHSTVTLSYNQIFLIHDLSARHLDQVAPKFTDPLRGILKQLGDAPAQVKKEDDRQVMLNLVDTRAQRISTVTQDAFGGPKVSPLYFQAKTLLLSVLRLLPGKSNGAKSLMVFLEQEKARALQSKDESLAEHISNVISMLNTLAEIKMLKPDDRMPSMDVFDAFLWEIAHDAMERKLRIVTVEKRLSMVEMAHKTIVEHHQYLQQRLELYKIYLENARAGGASSFQVAEAKKESSKKLRYTHTELEDMGIITRTDESIQRAVLKKCYYLFDKVAPGTFEITVHLKKGFDIKLLKKPIVVVLDDLLKMQEHGETTLNVEYVDLSVNLLIHLLNKEFTNKR